MEVLNRGAITITPKKPYIDWNNALFPDMLMEVDMLGESKTYLMSDLFDDAEKALKKKYKEIFENELESICLDEAEWPQKRSFKLFNEWFAYEISDYVYDLCI